MNEVNEAWKGYRLRVVPLDAGTVQCAETQRAYFAGAATLLQLLLATPGGVMSPPLARRAEALRQEIERYQAEVAAGRA